MQGAQGDAREQVQGFYLLEAVEDGEADRGGGINEVLLSLLCV